MDRGEEEEEGVVVGPGRGVIVNVGWWRRITRRVGGGSLGLEFEEDELLGLASAPAPAPAPAPASVGAGTGTGTGTGLLFEDRCC